MDLLRSWLLLPLLVLIPAATAQNVTNATAVHAASSIPIPGCGQLCFAQVLPQYDCSLSNIQCICPNANLTNDVSACLYSNCTVPDRLAVEKFSKNSCGAVSRNEAGNTEQVTWALFALAVFFVSCRCLARPECMHGSGYGSDDWTIICCISLLIPLNVLVQLMTHNGLGADNYMLEPIQITRMLEQFYVFEIIYTMIVMITKISILQLYLRIWTVEAVTVWFRRTCWIFIGIHIITMLAFCLSLVFQCKPVSYDWTAWDGLHSGTCIHQAAQIYVLGAVNIAYDVFVFILPLHNFLKLNISWRRKFGVCLIFMVGLVVTVCSIVRLQYLVKVGNSQNPTWDYNSTVMWSSVECNISVICTCMPAMAGLLQRLWSLLSGKPLSTKNSDDSKAPVHPTVIDPENPVSEDEMLHMRQPDSLMGSMTELNESDCSAPTEKLDRGDMAATQRGIEIKHEPPAETTATKMSYRDHTGRLHEVKVIDKPTEDKEARANESFPQVDESKAEALRSLREAETVYWRPEPSMMRDWKSEGPGRRL